MSQYVYCYYGYGVDLGDLEFKPKFSKNKKVQKDCQTIFDKFLDDDTLYDNDLDCSFEGTDYDDVTLTWHPNSEAYNFLLIIENEYVVGPNVKTYTVKEAKEHLTKAFNYLFDNWNEAYAKENKTSAPANTEQAICLSFFSLRFFFIRTAFSISGKYQNICLKFRANHFYNSQTDVLNKH